MREFGESFTCICGGPDAQEIGYPDKLGHRLYAELSHRMGAVHLHRDLADSEIGGDLLVQAAGGDPRHHIPLALAEEFEPLPQNRVRVFLCAPSAILFEGHGDGVEKILVPDRLSKEIYGTGLDGADRHGNIAIAGEKNDRHVNFGFR